MTTRNKQLKMEHMQESVQLAQAAEEHLNKCNPVFAFLAQLQPILEVVSYYVQRFYPCTNAPAANEVYTHLRPLFQELTDVCVGKKQVCKAIKHEAQFLASAAKDLVRDFHLQKAHGAALKLHSFQRLLEEDIAAYSRAVAGLFDVLDLIPGLEQRIQSLRIQEGSPFYYLPVAEDNFLRFMYFIRDVHAEVAAVNNAATRLRQAAGNISLAIEAAHNQFTCGHGQIIEPQDLLFSYSPFAIQGPPSASAAAGAGAPLLLAPAPAPPVPAPQAPPVPAPAPQALLAPLASVSPVPAAAPQAPLAPVSPVPAPAPLAPVSPAPAPAPPAPAAAPQAPQFVPLAFYLARPAQQEGDRPLKRMKTEF